MRSEQALRSSRLAQTDNRAAPPFVPKMTETERGGAPPRDVREVVRAGWSPSARHDASNYTDVPGAVLSRGLPPPDPDTGMLPVGIHVATWDEFRARFDTNPCRGKRFDDLLKVLQILKKHGCKFVVVGGSLSNDSKKLPNDFDVIYSAKGMEPDLLPWELNPSMKIKEMQKMIGGEIYPSNYPCPGHGTMLNFFLRDTREQCVRGVVGIEL